jgi:hypothetical protein
LFRFVWFSLVWLTSHSHSRKFIFMFIVQSYRSYQCSESLTVTYNKI